MQGWLDCPEGQERLVKDIVDRYDDGSYSQGWSIVTGPNDTVCVFYCGYIRESALEWLHDQLREIAGLPPPIDIEDRIRGLFFALHEGKGTQEWQVRDGQLLIEPLSSRYDYLFA